MVILTTGVQGDRKLWVIFNVGLLPSAMKCSGTCKVTFTVSGQDIWLPHTIAKMQELTATSVKAVLFTGLFNKPGKEIYKDITPLHEYMGISVEVSDLIVL